MAQHSWGCLSERLPGEQLPGSSCAAGGLEIPLLGWGTAIGACVGTSPGLAVVTLERLGFDSDFISPNGLFPLV